MLHKIAKMSAVALVSIAVLTSCSPTSNTVKPTVSPTSSNTATATATPSASASPSATTSPEAVATPSTAPVPEKMVADSVTLMPDSVKIVDNGVEQEFLYVDAPQDVITSLNNVFGEEATYNFTGEAQPCNYNVSEYIWGNTKLRFPGQDTSTTEGFWVSTSSKDGEGLGVDVKTRSGIRLGDSVESARAAAGQDALYEPSEVDAKYGLLLDGQSESNPVSTTTNEEGYTYEVTPNGTLVGFEDNAAWLLLSPQYFYADC